MFEGLGLLSASPPAAFLVEPDASKRTSSGRRARRGGCSDDGRLYLAIDGAIYVTRDDAPAPIPLPSGAPPPTDPIVWIP